MSTFIDCQLFPETQQHIDMYLVKWRGSKSCDDEWKTEGELRNSSKEYKLKHGDGTHSTHVRDRVALVARTAAWMVAL